MISQSCRNDRRQEYPELENQEQKSPHFEVVILNGKEYIDMEKSVCFSRVYEITKTNVGSVGNELDLPIMECHKIIGRSPEEYGVFATWLENFRFWLIGFN